MLSQIQASRGNLDDALKSIEKAIKNAKCPEDRHVLYYGYLDKADILMKIAEKCYKQGDSICYKEMLTAADTNYKKAEDISTGLKLEYLSDTVKFFRQEIRMRQTVIQKE